MDSQITSLNQRRGNIKVQITKILNVTDDKSFNVAEWKVHLVLLSKVEEKVKIIKQEYYKIVDEDKLDETEQQLLQMDEDIQKLEVSLKHL